MPYLDCSGLSRPHAQLVFLVDLSPPHAMQEILGWILDSSRFELASKPLFGRSLLCALVSLAIGLHLGAFFWIGLMDGQWFLSSLGIGILSTPRCRLHVLVGSFECSFYRYWSTPRCRLHATGWFIRVLFRGGTFWQLSLVHVGASGYAWYHTRPPG